MIIMYERIIGYANVCSSVQDHIIKFWLQSHAFGYDTSYSELKEKHFGTQEKHRNFWRLERWYEERSTKRQSSDHKMHQALKTLMRTSSNWFRHWRNQVLKDTSTIWVTLTSFVFFWSNIAFKVLIVLLVFFWPYAKTNKEL